jgi:hypothetical protein
LHLQRRLYSTSKDYEVIMKHEFGEAIAIIKELATKL